MERSVSLTGGAQPMDAFAVVTARVAGVPWPKLAALPATAWIDFRGGAGTFPAVPFADVLAGQPAALSMLRHRIVVLAITAPSKHDNAHHTDAPGRSVMTGTEQMTQSDEWLGVAVRDHGSLRDLASPGGSA